MARVTRAGRCVFAPPLATVNTDSRNAVIGPENRIRFSGPIRSIERCRRTALRAMSFPLQILDALSSAAAGILRPTGRAPLIGRLSAVYGFGRVATAPRV
ncbi:hypothetical protein [Ensifer sp. LCM 4579]|uniref:hypothetical protein n=1 Tax=Ensifer sp. LCM 4579 TaxID=1848292 RepID=UPI0008DA7072|nr:hypothetical protein [Ensifer sp. LCM 4579]OHV77952.1 hypothetical protein LCM4579_06265 [Ensifer sp. LCM 4579]